MAESLSRKTTDTTAGIKEAIKIRKRSPKTMNRDEGAYMPSHTRSAILRSGRLTDSGRCGPPVKKTDRWITSP